MSSEKLQSNLLAFFEKGVMQDVSIICEGREIKAHRAVLASQCVKFSEMLQASGKERLEVPNVRYKVMQALIKFMYFGGFGGRDVSAEDALDALLIAEDWGISALGPQDITPLIVSQLTVQNCLVLMRHEGLLRQKPIAEAVCAFVGEHFLAMISTMEVQLLSIPREFLSSVLRVTCRKVTTDSDTECLVKFCLSHTQLDSACDLLRETKQWQWGSDQPTLLMAPPSEEQSEGFEWRIEKVRAAMEQTPARVVCGEYFDWCIRLDYGSEGKLRIVYEAATPRDAANRLCIDRFPAAMFAWRVLYRGADVFYEKPVFICFPENVSLHWSTTLPVNAAELTDDDELCIMVTMAENPMLSLVLYYFSADLKTTVFSEDILNRLPHIEYRCLSSYSLVKTHVRD
jgi:hypothetical protein